MAFAGITGRRSRSLSSPCGTKPRTCGASRRRGTSSTRKVRQTPLRGRRCSLERVSDLNATDRGTGGWQAPFGDARAFCARPGRDTAARTRRTRGDAPAGAAPRPPSRVASRISSALAPTLKTVGSQSRSIFAKMFSRFATRTPLACRETDPADPRRFSLSENSSQSALCAR